MSNLGTILPATWRGQTFGVVAIRNKLGRRTALHEYPYRDTVWIEDLGSGLRAFGFRGFLAGPFAEVQHAALCAAMDVPGIGTLTHPSLGVFQGVIVDFCSSQSVEFVNGYELEFEFIESAEPVFPASVADTIAGVRLGALNLLSAATGAFGVAMRVAGVALGAIAAAPAIVAALMSLPRSMAGDAALIGAGVTSIGAGFGPYASRAASPVTAADAERARAAVLASVAAANASAATGAAQAIGPALAAVPAAVRASATDPAGQVRAMLALSASSARIATASDAIGAARAAAGGAMVRVFRRSAMVEMARAAADSAPASQGEALALRDRVCAALDLGATDAGDAGESDVLAALSALRAAVVADLTARGAGAAPLRTVETGAPAPALVLAQRLYRDGTRADDLTRRARPWHPAFMPQKLVVPAE